MKGSGLPEFYKTHPKSKLKASPVRLAFLILVKWSYVDLLIVDNVRKSVNNSSSKDSGVYKKPREKPHYL